jgi:hypothetical protein
MYLCTYATVTLCLFDQARRLIDYRYLTGECFMKRSWLRLPSSLLSASPQHGHRGIHQNGRFYVVIVGAGGTDKATLDKYKDLLNSFGPSYNVSDRI